MLLLEPVCVGNLDAFDEVDGTRLEFHEVVAYSGRTLKITRLSFGASAASPDQASLGSRTIFWPRSHLATFIGR